MLTKTFEEAAITVKHAKENAQHLKIRKRKENIGKYWLFHDFKKTILSFHPPL